MPSTQAQHTLVTSGSVTAFDKRKLVPVAHIKQAEKVLYVWQPRFQIFF